MPQVAKMPISFPQIALILLGLILAFFGLSIYKGFLKVLGFIVGAGYAIYLATLLAASADWDPVVIYVGAAVGVIVLGILGTFIAQFANALMFFLAGGLVGVVLGKILTGVPAEQAVEYLNPASITNLIRPEPGDLLWFLGGGFVFVIAIDVLIMLAFATLGAGLIWFAVRPLQLLQQDWLIPLVIGILGLMVQEGSRRRYVPPRPIPIQRRPQRREPE